MSSERLRDAAQKIREVATAATCEPWQAGKSWAGALAVMGSIGQPIAVVAMDAAAAGEADSMGDAAHIALWSPPVALAVADWLDYEASRETYHLAEFGYRVAPNQANAVADAILGPVTAPA